MAEWLNMLKGFSLNSWIPQSQGREVLSHGLLGVVGFTPQSRMLSSDEQRRSLVKYSLALSLADRICMCFLDTPCSGGKGW